MFRYTVITKLIRHISVRKFSKPEYTNISTAAILVTGNEILKGEVLDTNSNFLSKNLHNLGITVKKITVVGDEVNAISEEVRELSSRFKYVITSGGIGPTHDDVTFEGVAKAFNQPLVLNSELVETCFKFYNTRDPNAPGMKLAKIPKLAKLNYDTKREAVYPTVSLNNVYMFPGIPELLKKSFLYVGTSLFQSKERFFSKTIYANLSEDKCAKALDMIVDRYPDVHIGSYPQYANTIYKVKITLESADPYATSKAYEDLKKLLPRDGIVNEGEYHPQERK